MHRTHLAFLRAALFALLLLLAGCGRSGDTTERKERLVVFAAASLREVFTRLEHDFEREHPEAEVVLHFAGSQELRAQLEHGAEADVFASADRSHVDKLVRAGLAQDPVVFARNEPVLAVALERAQAIRSLADLPRAERLAFGAPQVPIGQYTTRILERGAALYGADFRERVEARVVSYELNVKQVLARVSLGEVDAGIVYRSDVRAAGGRVIALPLPASLDVIAEYPIALVPKTRRPELGRAWIGLVLSPAGQRELALAGFLPPAEAPDP